MATEDFCGFLDISDDEKSHKRLFFCKEDLDSSLFVINGIDNPQLREGLESPPLVVKKVVKRASVVSRRF